MAEIRKHNPSGNEIADAVRAALGDDIRPIPPGSEREHFDPFVAETETAAPDLPDTISSLTGPLIGSLPPGMTSWFVVPDDEE